MCSLFNRDPTCARVAQPFSIEPPTRSGVCNPKMLLGLFVFGFEPARFTQVGTIHRADQRTPPPGPRVRKPQTKRLPLQKGLHHEQRYRSR